MIVSTIQEGIVIERDGQAFDGFSVTIRDDEEFKGVYSFDHSWDWEGAIASIMDGDTLPDGE